jgi:hypothetical protein
MDNRKIVISFDEGCSGNFLAALLSNSEISAFNRIDVKENILSYNILPSINGKIKNTKSIIVTHEHRTDVIEQISDVELIIRIVPVTGIFTAIYNVFVKKAVAEKFTDIMDQWPNNTAYCYDMIFENLKDYYNKFSNSTLDRDQVLFDFGWFYNTDKLVQFVNDLGRNCDLTVIEKYQQAQLPLLLSLPKSNRMEDIVKLVPDVFFENSPWFFCYCLFCFEQNNHLLENQRQYSIDQFNKIMTAQDLISLSHKYHV